MTLDEAIERYEHNAEYERQTGNLQGCMEFRQLADWLKQLSQIEQIINSPVYIQEDVLKYKMIVEVLKGEQK